MSSQRRRGQWLAVHGSRPRAASSALLMLATAAGLLGAVELALAIDFPYLIFTWGKSLEFLEQSVDFDTARMRLKVGDDDTMTVPLASISQVFDAEGNLAYDFTLDGIALDAWDPLDASRLKPVSGWSPEEVWGTTSGNPRWAFRWTEGTTAMAMISRPPGHFEALELRLLPISYAQRRLGDNPDPELQSVRVTLDGRLIGDLHLTVDEWYTYRLALQPRSVGQAAFLKLEASYAARPVDFSGGDSVDGRELGVALDYVRFVSLEDHPR